MFDLTERDAYLVLATDGLWDELDRKESARLCTTLEADLEKKAAENDGVKKDENAGKLDTKKVCGLLMHNALQNAS